MEDCKYQQDKSNQSNPLEKRVELRSFQICKRFFIRIYFVVAFDIAKIIL